MEGLEDFHPRGKKLIFIYPYLPSPMNPESPSNVFECDKSCDNECLNCILYHADYDGKVKKLKWAFLANMKHLVIQEEKIRKAQRIKERYELNLKGNRDDLKILQDKVNKLIIKLQDKPELLKDTRIKDEILKMNFE